MNNHEYARQRSKFSRHVTIAGNGVRLFRFGLGFELSIKLSGLNHAECYVMVKISSCLWATVQMFLSSDAFQTAIVFSAFENQSILCHTTCRVVGRGVASLNTDPTSDDMVHLAYWIGFLDLNRCLNVRSIRARKLDQVTGLMKR